MVASDVPSKQNHVQVLEVNSLALRSFPGYLDLLCVCRIHTTVRTVGRVFPPHISKQSTAYPWKSSGAGEAVDTVVWRVQPGPSDRAVKPRPSRLPPGLCLTLELVWQWRWRAFPASS